MNSLDSMQQNIIPDAFNLVPYVTVHDSVSVVDTLSTGVMEVGAEAVFGLQSTLSGGGFVDNFVVTPLVSNVIFQSTVLIFFVLYSIFIHQNINDISLLFRNLALDKKDKKGRFSNNINSKYNSFVLIMQCIGIMLVGISGVKLIDFVMPGETVSLFSQNITIFIAPIIMGLYVLVTLFQYLVLTIIGAITVSNNFISALISLKIMASAIITIIAAPVTILYALSPPKEGGILGIILILIIILSLIWFLIKTIALFISKKISILQWFLYLCCVEIFPISLIVAYIVKY